MSTKFRICNFCVQIFWDTTHLLKIDCIENFLVLNFLLMHGITGSGCPSKLKRNCEGHCAFVVAIVYQIQLFEREPHNAVDQYNSN